jgi:hypothetical protein
MHSSTFDLGNVDPILLKEYKPFWNTIVKRKQQISKSKKGLMNKAILVVFFQE